jgi:polysaccharide export outer membrane protein
MVFALLCSKPRDNSGARRWRRFAGWRHRIRWTALGLAVLTLATASARAADDADLQLLAPGDKIAVVVFGHADLSGEFLIDGTGGVEFPLAGLIPVAGLTVQKAKERIAERLADGYLQRPAVSLRLSEPRPIFVVGDVRLPGSYPFRYGASVLSAVATAGGYGLPEQPGQQGGRTDFLLADERLRVLEANQRALLVRRARLLAQRNGAVTFSLPRHPSLSANDVSVAQLVAEQHDILSTESVSLQQQLRLLREQKPRLEAEIVGVKEQIKNEARQLELIQQHLEDYNKLLSSGLARRYTGIELQREEARNKSNLGRLAADIARLENSIGEVALRIHEAENSYRRRILADLQDVGARLQELETTLPMAREVRAARLQQGGAALGAAQGEIERTITIHRARGLAAPAPFQATEATRLLPGDIVEIRRLRAPGATPATSVSHQAQPGPEVAGRSAAGVVR